MRWGDARTKHSDMIRIARVFISVIYRTLWHSHVNAARRAASDVAAAAALTPETLLGIKLGMLFASVDDFSGVN